MKKLLLNICFFVNRSASSIVVVYIINLNLGGKNEKNYHFHYYDAIFI